MKLDWERLIVRAGDKVQATGKFVVRGDSSATIGRVGVATGEVSPMDLTLELIGLELIHLRPSIIPVLVG